MENDSGTERNLSSDRDIIRDCAGATGRRARFAQDQRIGGDKGAGLAAVLAVERGEGAADEASAQIIAAAGSGGERCGEGERESVGEGKRGSVGVEPGGRRSLKKKKNTKI